MAESLYEVLAEPASREPGPGTIRTSAVETVDDDAIGIPHVINETGSRGARVPHPGTVFTKSPETVDEDGVTDAALLLGYRPGRPADTGSRVTETVETIDEDGASLADLLR
jgi:hypothetical protein